MQFSNFGSASIDRCDVAVVSTEGDRFVVKLVESEIGRELNALGAISPRSMQRNIMVPFSTVTVKYLLGLTKISDCTEESDWFKLENCLKEIAGFGSQRQYPRIKSIRDGFCDHILSTMTEKNCFLIHKKFRQFDCSEHAIKTMEYILYNLVRMVVVDKIVDVEFFRLPVEELIELLGSDDVNVEKEIQIVEVIGRWIMANRNDREKFRPMLMSTVRLLSLDNESAEMLKEYRLSMRQPRKTRDILMIVGGWLHRQACNNIEWFDPECNDWKTSQLKLPMPIAYHGAAIVDGILYVFGGSNGIRTRCETWKLSMTTCEWEKCDNMLEPRNYISNSSVVFDGKIYVFGGQNWRELNRVGTRSRTGEVYDPKTNRWTPTGMLHDMRSDCAAAVFESQIYVCGGFNGEQILSSVEVYNPIGDFFSRYIDLPYPITGHSLVNHHEQLFIIGGFDGLERQNKIWIWNRKGEWQERPEKMMFGRSTSAACSYKGWIFSVAGYTDKVESSCEALVPHMDAARFGLIPAVPRAKSALKVLVAPNWRSFLDKRGVENGGMAAFSDDESFDDASTSYIHY